MPALSTVPVAGGTAVAAVPLTATTCTYVDRDGRAVARFHRGGRDAWTHPLGWSCPVRSCPDAPAADEDRRRTRSHRDRVARAMAVHARTAGDYR